MSLWMKKAIENNDEKAIIIMKAKLQNDCELALAEKNYELHSLTVKKAQQLLKEIKSPSKNSINPKKS